MKPLNVSQLARAFSLHRQTVRRRIEDAGIEPCDVERGTRLYRVGAVARALVVPDLAARSGPDGLAPVQRKAWWQSEAARVAVEREQARLIASSAFHRELASMLKNIAAALESLPDVLERAGSDLDVLERIEAETDRQRQSMYDALIADTADG